MKKIILITLLLSTVFIYGKDGRIKYLTFGLDEIFTVKATSGYLTVIQFSKSETVISAATGFKDGWDIGSVGNFIYIKPIGFKAGESEIEPNAKDWRTNIFIQTTRRTYMGNLEVSENNEYQYRISFKYPEDDKERAREKARKEKARKEALRKAEKEKAEKERIKNELAKKTVPRNWNYVLNKNKNSEEIVPDYVYDDGTFTYFGFNKTKSFPTIFEKEELGESLLSTHAEKNNDYNVLVVHQLVKLIYLRKGNKLVAIFNKGYGVNPNYEYSDTINKNIKREIIR
jgi:type IV secretion system protein VirB9